MSDGETEEKPKVTVEHVTIKMPDFMESAVMGWFKILEAQFTLKGVTTSATKFLHVLATLPANIVSKIPEAIILSNKYEKLKDAVISIYEETKPELLDKLMSSTTMAGRPSVYLAEMLTVAARIGVNDTVVRHKFIQNLLESVRPVIAAQQEVPTDQLGKLTDNLLPYFNKSSSVFHVENSSSSPNYTRKRHSGNLPSGLKPFNADQRPKVCRAHLYFAEKARNCRPWCRWPNKSTCKIFPNSRSSSRNSSRNSSPSRSSSINEVSHSPNLVGGGL